MNLRQILTHPGGAHADEFLACSVLAALHGCPIVRREPDDADLDDASIAVVDVGHRHEPQRSNFDHHQFPPDHPPVCALSLVLMHLGLYDDAREFCDWLETTERFDVTGPNSTAAWLGVDREALARLQSPIVVTLLRRFARCRELAPDDPLHQAMVWIGQDLLDFIGQLRERLAALAEIVEIWETPRGKVAFIPRTDPLPEEPSSGIGFHLKRRGLEREIIALVTPDRRGGGYGLSRFNDHPACDFTRISEEADVHFAHLRGFVAKSSATETARLRELLALAQG